MRYNRNCRSGGDITNPRMRRHRRTPVVKSKIGQRHLGQDQDGGKQHQLENQNRQLPALHENATCNFIRMTRPGVGCQSETQSPRTIPISLLPFSTGCSRARYLLRLLHASEDHQAFRYHQQPAMIHGGLRGMLVDGFPFARRARRTQMSPGTAPPARRCIRCRCSCMDCRYRPKNKSSGLFPRLPPRSGSAPFQDGWAVWSTESW